MRAVLLSLVLLALTGCAMNDVGEGASGPLLPSLQATAMGDSVHFVLQVTNTSDAPITLHFRSGQSYDFAVLRGDLEVWRWSDEQMFTQALRQEAMAAGETRRYEVSWRPPAGLHGDLLAVGQFTSRSHPVEQRAHFRLP